MVHASAALHKGAETSLNEFYFIMVALFKKCIGYTKRTLTLIIMAGLPFHYYRWSSHSEVSNCVVSCHNSVDKPHNGPDHLSLESSF